MSDLSSSAFSDEEISYLCDAASEYFQNPILPKDVIWTYSGVRPLYDDKSENASAVTRDYVLHLDEFSKSAPFLSIFGGKITTSRKLAEHALEKLSPYYKSLAPAWTKNESLPGGDIPDADFETFVAKLEWQFPDLGRDFLKRLAKRYGTRVNRILYGSSASLGEIFNDLICESEIQYLIEFEWAEKAEDILWRRTKSGLHMSKQERETFTRWFDAKYRAKS